jgi:hypothetical protein
MESEPWHQKQKEQAPGPAPFRNLNRRKLFLRGSALSGRGSREYRALMGRLLLHQDSEADGGDHEDHGSPAGRLCKQVRSRTRSKGRLRTLAAEGPSQICALALLQKNDRDQEQAHHNVNYDKQINHANAFLSEILDKFAGRLVRKRGLEPLCLSAPPPQDGVSAISPLPHAGESLSFQKYSKKIT